MRRAALCFAARHIRYAPLVRVVHARSREVFDIRMQMLSKRKRLFDDTLNPKEMQGTVSVHRPDPETSLSPPRADRTFFLLQIDYAVPDENEHDWKTGRQTAEGADVVLQPVRDVATVEQQRGDARAPCT